LLPHLSLQITRTNSQSGPPSSDSFRYSKRIYRNFLEARSPHFGNQSMAGLPWGTLEHNMAPITPLFLPLEPVISSRVSWKCSGGSECTAIIPLSFVLTDTHADKPGEEETEEDPNSPDSETHTGGVEVSQRRSRGCLRPNLRGL